MMTSSLTTVDLPEGKRFDFWREAVCNSFFQLDFERASDRPFAGEITATRVKEVCFSHVRSRGQKTVRTLLQIQKDRKEVAVLHLQVRGAGFFFQDGREARLGPGDFTLCDSTRPHSAILSDDFEQIVLHMPRSLWVRRVGRTEQLTARVVRGDTLVGAFVSNVLRQVFSVAANADPGTAHRLVDTSLEMVSAAFADLISRGEPLQSAGRIALLYRAKVLIEENLSDPGFTSQKAASSLGISLRYLQDLFQQDYTTVNDWIWERRLEKCRRKLSDPLLSSEHIGQIAFDCGFENFSHFCRRFKSAFSMSASEFRREQRVLQ